ncbi:MAG TPA: MG2 domain-containing protein [Fibrobacteria bacterium]|nr:MG2 domain-containing protein [Fibrobacteria bacterium]
MPFFRPLPPSPNAPRTASGPALFLSVLSLSLWALALAGCGKKEAGAGGGASKPDEALATVVAGYSGGAVSADGPIRVTLVDPGANPASVNKALDESPFEFSPAVKGVTVWADERTLEFRPSRRLERGRAYDVALRLDKVIAVPEKLAKFAFRFTAMTQHFERDLGGLEITDEKNLQWQRLDGLLRLADGEDAPAVEKMLTAFQNGKALPIVWDHRPDRREHPFHVDSLRRGEDSSLLVLDWDGAPIGVPEKREDSVSIPSINAFRVLDVASNRGDERYLSVRLSDPPRKGLDFRGLIEVTDQGGLRFQVERNEVRVYSNSDWNGTKTVRISDGIRNSFGKALQNPGSWTVAFEEMKPDVRFVGKGVILPGDGKLTLAFEAVNLKAVNVSVVRIFAGNVPQFLQVNALDGQQELRRVGRPILKKIVALDPTPSMRPRWARYALDLTELARKDAQPGTLYRVTLSFKRNQSTYPCADSAAAEKEDAGLQDAGNRLPDKGWDGEDGYYSDQWGEEGDEGGDYHWREREDPCTPSYFYYDRIASRNFLPSDVGLMAKIGRPGKVMIVATDLLTAGPMADADLEILNYQHQVLAKGRTDGDGFAELDLQGKPFLLRASKGNQRGYLKLDDPAALQMGSFDVGGTPVQEGLKGFLFGERGVWRPGDSLHLAFILEDREGRLPAGHPISFELRDPQGRVVRTLTRAPEGGFCGFSTATDADAPTGDYLARVKAGPAVFEEKIKIETVMPNRLRIKADFSPKPLTRGKPIGGSLDVSWLSGAVAKHLEAEVELTLVNAEPAFQGFDGYRFTDPSRKFSPETQTLFQGRIDGEGKASFSKQVDLSARPPGTLKANFRTRVLEAGGGFSLDRWSEPFHPYAAFVGFKLPTSGQGRDVLFIDTANTVKLAVLDPQGNRIAKRRVEIELYRLDWRWWWERDEEAAAAYLSDESKRSLKRDTVEVANGAGIWNLTVKYPDYGRYLLRACDLDAGTRGHCSAQTVYMEYPYYYGRSEREGPGEGAAVLSFGSDKAKYNVGEKIRLTIPSPKGGRALISIEKGAGIYKRYWVDLKEKETLHEIAAEPGMAPNVYVYVALLQPHKQTENDLPIRMYNVIPILVEDPATRLHPRIDAQPGVFRPGGKADIAVSEADGKPMRYVVAVVDEGLLDLTRFKTPDPWQRFYAREALGVKSWDLYDFVAGAYGDRLERILSIGGDEDGVKAPDGRKGNRFPPMVEYLGPFTLDKGKRARHSISIPQYVGSVRIMVVAGRDGAYGSAEKAVPVRKPLMVLGTLPRILSPGESFELPISVFALEKRVKDVEVEVTATGPVRIAGERRRSLSVAAPTDELVSFRMEASEAVGWGKVAIKARSGNEKAEQTLEVEVRNPNTRVTDVIPALVQPGQSWSRAFKLPGVAGTNKATVELSRLPPIDLGKRLRYLVRYPHGCVEQTTSSAFPQLYLDALMDLPAGYSGEIEANVKAAIQRLRGFQTPDGGFGYWPGDPNPNDWATSYAGHFLLEAEKKGYSVPAGMLDRWKRYQRTFAQGWTAKYDYWNPLSQSYRLYTLALAGTPEPGAMNRLKESKDLSATARWQLGGAYQLAGQPEVAASLVKGAPETVKPYKQMGGTFGSDLRDKAMMLEVLSLMGRKAEATPLAQEVAADLAKPDWWSTQSTAYGLIAIARYAGKLLDRGVPMAYALELNGAGKDGEFAAPLLMQEVKVIEGRENRVEIRNRSKGTLYARLIVEGVPPLGRETAAANGIGLSMEYQDMKGRPLDPASLEQGKDFVAEVRVRHPGGRGAYEQLALSALFPSGWEIRNTRMDTIADASGKSASGFAYRDFRDDRVYTYFNLHAGEEKLYRFFLNAAYLGHFHLPQSRVEAMYDAEINARTKGMPVDVVPDDGRPGDPDAPSGLGKKKEAKGPKDRGDDRSGDEGESGE